MEYYKYATENARSTRNIEELSNKLDRLAATEKPKSYSSYPKTVREATKISWDNYDLACGAAVGEFDEDNDKESEIDRKDLENLIVNKATVDPSPFYTFIPVVESDSTMKWKRRETKDTLKSGRSRRKPK